MSTGKSPGPAKGANALRTPDKANEGKETSRLRLIIPDGDVILVVGPKKQRIQLSSHLLSSTSSVFKVMLGPSFREGALLREEGEGPTEIVFPEDNAQAVWNTFCVLYGAHPRLRWLRPDEIYGVARLAGKYDIFDRLGLACDAWFRTENLDSVGSTESGWTMLVAAYLLRSEFGFAKMTQKFINEKKDSFLE